MSAKGLAEAIRALKLVEAIPTSPSGLPSPEEDDAFAPVRMREAARSSAVAKKWRTAALSNDVPPLKRISGKLREAADDHFYGPWSGGAKAAGGRPSAGEGASDPELQKGEAKDIDAIQASPEGLGISDAEQERFDRDVKAVAAQYDDVMGVQDVPALGGDALHVLTRVNHDIHEKAASARELEAWDAVMGVGMRVPPSGATIYRAHHLPPGVKVGDRFVDPGYRFASGSAKEVTTYQRSRTDPRSLVRMQVQPGIHAAERYGYPVLERNLRWTVTGREPVMVQGERQWLWNVRVDPPAAA